MKEEYDLFLSVGSACRPAMHLKNNELRFLSSPLDWQYGYSLETVLHLFETKFQDFFLNIEENKEWPGSGNNRRIVDISNQIISIHHFDKALPLDECHKLFMESMKKRFDRLDRVLIQSKRIMIICNRKESKESLLCFARRFGKLYPNLNITLVNVWDNKEKKKDYFEEEYLDNVSDNITIKQYVFNDSIDIDTEEKFDASGNTICWNKLLSNYRLSVLSSPFSAIEKHREIVVFGAGKISEFLLMKLQKYDFIIKGIAVTNILDNPKEYMGYKVKSISEYDKSDSIVIALKNMNVIEEIIVQLKREQFINIYYYDYEQMKLIQYNK